VSVARWLAVLGSPLALGCDAVPDLYVVVDASVGDGSSGDEGAFESGDAGDAGSEACTGVSCPDCPPNPGMCCNATTPCEGANCAVDCAGGCSSCTGQLCCSKQGGPPMCRGDASKCP
jgi:hypothetical protein